MWAACLRPRSGQTFAAKRLGADNRADLIAVYVNISGVHPIADKLRCLINSAVDAEGQAITARVDLLAYAIEAIALKAGNRLLLQDQAGNLQRICRMLQEIEEEKKR